MISLSLGKWKVLRPTSIGYWRGLAFPTTKVALRHCSARPLAAYSQHALSQPNALSKVQQRVGIMDPTFSRSDYRCTTNTLISLST